MSCTEEESAVFDQFQRSRDQRIIVEKISQQEKIEKQKDSRRKSHMKGKKGKSIESRSVLGQLYPPNEMQFQQKKESKNQEKKKKKEINKTERDDKENKSPSNEQLTEEKNSNLTPCYKS